MKKTTLTFRVAYAVLLVINLSACAMVTTEPVGVNNKKTYGIDCSGKLISMDVCYKKAARLCPSGYNIIANSAPPPTPVPWYNPPQLPITIPGDPVIPGVVKGITITCK